MSKNILLAVDTAAHDPARHVVAAADMTRDLARDSGDHVIVPSERTVTVAIGHGKKAARSIDAFLRGTGSPGGGQARARLVRCLEYLVLHGRPGHRPAPAGGGPADHHL